MELFFLEDTDLKLSFTNTAKQHLSTVSVKSVVDSVYSTQSQEWGDTAPDSKTLLKAHFEIIVSG